MGPKAHLLRMMNEPITLCFGGGHAVLAWGALVCPGYPTPDRAGQAIVADGHHRMCPELDLSRPLSTRHSQEPIINRLFSHPVEEVGQELSPNLGDGKGQAAAA